MVVISQFIIKLASLCTSALESGCAQWSPDGRTFHVYDESAFDAHVAETFPNAKTESFKRQLANYQFVKQDPCVQGVKYGFAHELFTREHDERKLAEIQNVRSNKAKGRRPPPPPARAGCVDPCSCKAKCDRLEQENDSLRSKLEQLKKQQEYPRFKRPRRGFDHNLSQNECGLVSSFDHRVREGCNTVGSQLYGIDPPNHVREEFNFDNTTGSQVYEIDPHFQMPIHSENLNCNNINDLQALQFFDDDNKSIGTIEDVERQELLINFDQGFNL